MPCYSPLKAYYSAEKNGSGKRGLVFNRKASLDATPIPIPCGQCIGCRIDKVSEKATRCMHELRMCRDAGFESSFITLTYSDDHLPSDGGLVREHPQAFMKRLREKARRSTGQKEIRFYGCGEYGGRFHRPHYHILLFNFDFADKRIYSRGKRDGDTLYTSDVLKDLWPHGHHAIGDVTVESCKYVAGYMMDKINISKQTPEWMRDWYQGLLPEFSMQSLKPGIGHSFYMKYGHEIYAHDSVIVDGKPLRPPRFYDERYKMVDSMYIDELKVKRRQKALAKAEDNTPERRRVREEVQRRKVLLSKKGL